MGVFRDKEYHRIAEIMGPLASIVFTVDLPNAARSLPADRLAEALHPYCADVRCSGSTDPAEGECRTGNKLQIEDEYQKKQAGEIRHAVREAMREAGKDDVILAFGSLSYLHQVKCAYAKEKGNER